MNMRRVFIVAAGILVLLAGGWMVVRGFAAPASTPDTKEQASPSLIPTETAVVNKELLITEPPKTETPNPTDSPAPVEENELPIMPIESELIDPEPTYILPTEPIVLEPESGSNAG